MSRRGAVWACLLLAAAPAFAQEIEGRERIGERAEWERGYERGSEAAREREVVREALTPREEPLPSATDRVAAAVRRSALKHLDPPDLRHPKIVPELKLKPAFSAEALRRSQA